MKIIFVNRFFYPDHAATSQILSDLAFDLAARGRDVHVVTSRQRYDDPAAALPICESLRGVAVHRAWSTRFGRGNLVGRAADYASFYLGAGWTLLRLAGRDAVIVAKTDPPLISVVAAVIAKLRGAQLVNWLQDLFPEVAVGLLLDSESGRKASVRQRVLGQFFQVLRRLRNWSLRRAVCNVAIGDLMRDRLVKEIGMDSQGQDLSSTLRESESNHRIRIIHNWADGKAICPVASTENPLRWKWGVADKFVVGYSGNLGRAHDISTVLQAMQRLRDDDRLVFMFIGGGAQLQQLHDACGQLGLGNVLFKPYQPRETLHLSLNVPDVHLIILQPAMEGLIVPSKFYGIVATGRPSVFIGDPKGEIAAIQREADCGYAVATGDDEGLTETLRNLVADSSLCAELGRNARTLFEKRFDQQIALQAWNDLFDELRL